MNNDDTHQDTSPYPPIGRLLRITGHNEKLSLGNKGRFEEIGLWRMGGAWSSTGVALLTAKIDSTTIVNLHKAFDPPFSILFELKHADKRQQTYMSGNFSANLLGSGDKCIHRPTDQIVKGCHIRVTSASRAGSSGCRWSTAWEGYA